MLFLFLMVLVLMLVLALVLMLALVLVLVLIFILGIAQTTILISLVSALTFVSFFVIVKIKVTIVS